MSDKNLDAIFNLKFYRKQENWRLRREKTEKSGEPNKKRILDETFTVNDVNIAPNSSEKLPENQEIETSNKKKAKQNAEYQEDKQNGRKGSKESTYLKSSTNSQTVGQFEKKVKDFEVKTPDVCIDDAQYSLIGQTKGKIIPDLNKSAVTIRPGLDDSLRPNAKPRVKSVELRLKKLLQASQTNDCVVKPLSRRNSDQYYLPAEELYQSYQQQPLQQPRNPHSSESPDCYKVDGSSASKVSSEYWPTEKDDLHKYRDQCSQWYEKFGEGFMEREMYKMVDDDEKVTDNQDFEEYQNEVCGRIESEESTNLDRYYSINSQTVAQLEKKEKGFEVKTPDVCIDDAQYSPIDQTKGKIIQDLNKSAVIMRPKLDDSLRPNADDRIKSVELRWEEFFKAAMKQEVFEEACGVDPHRRSDANQYDLPDEAFYQSYQQQPLQQPLYPHVPDYQCYQQQTENPYPPDFHKADPRSLSKIFSDWETEKEVMHNNRMQCFGWSDANQYDLPDEAFYQSYQQQPLQQPLYPHVPDYQCYQQQTENPYPPDFYKADPRSLSKIFSDWETEKEVMHNNRMQCFGWYEKFGRGFMGGELNKMVEDLDSYQLAVQARMERNMAGKSSWWCDSVDSNSFMVGAHDVPHSSYIESPEPTYQTFDGLQDFEAFRISPNVSDDSDSEYTPYFDRGKKLYLYPQREKWRFPFVTRDPSCSFWRPSNRPRPPIVKHFDDVFVAGSHLVTEAEEEVCKFITRLEC